MSKITFIFEHANNGAVVEVIEGEEKDTYVYQEPEYSTELQEKEAWRSFLYLLTERFGPQANRYGLEEIKIDIRPGNKCESKDDLTWFLKDCYYNPTPEQIEAAYAALNAIFNPERSHSEV